MVPVCMRVDTDGSDLVVLIHHATTMDGPTRHHQLWMCNLHRAGTWTTKRRDAREWMVDCLLGRLS